MKNFNIHFINHASLLIETGEIFFLTDPWYISPAFGKWIQNPFPSIKSIKKILSLNQKKLYIAISHGHDDHLDDFFIKNYLSKATPIIPKLDKKGFYKRVSGLFDEKPIEVDMKGKKIKNILINSFTNQEFTHHDSIITFSTDKELIIHANDNWHEQPINIIQNIANLSKNKIVYYFSQLGIADSFPIIYEGFSLDEKKVIMTERCKKYISTFEKNLKKIKTEFAYSYANQAKIENSFGLIPYDFIINELKENPCIRQIYPDDIVNKNGLSNSKDNGQDIFKYLLNRLEIQTNNFIKSKINSEIKVKFLNDTEISNFKPDKKIVYYSTSVLNWLNIFSGKLTLESISIGGEGKILKDKKTNIRDIHHAISEYAYIFQNKETKNLF